MTLSVFCDITSLVVQSLEEAAANALWEDEDTRTFYENLIDLKAVIPGVSYCMYSGGLYSNSEHFLSAMLVIDTNTNINTIKLLEFERYGS